MVITLSPVPWCWCPGVHWTPSAPPLQTSQVPWHLGRAKWENITNKANLRNCTWFRPEPLWGSSNQLNLRSSLLKCSISSNSNQLSPHYNVASNNFVTTLLIAPSPLLSPLTGQARPWLSSGWRGHLSPRPQYTFTFTLQSSEICGDKKYSSFPEPCVSTLVVTLTIAMCGSDNWIQIIIQSKSGANTRML